MEQIGGEQLVKAAWSTKVSQALLGVWLKDSKIDKISVKIVCGFVLICLSVVCVSLFQSLSLYLSVSLSLCFYLWLCLFLCLLLFFSLFLCLTFLLSVSLFPFLCLFLFLFLYLSTLSISLSHIPHTSKKIFCVFLLLDCEWLIQSFMSTYMFHFILQKKKLQDEIIFDMVVSFHWGKSVFYGTTFSFVS